MTKDVWPSSAQRSTRPDSWSRSVLVMPDISVPRGHGGFVGLFIRHRTQVALAAGDKTCKFRRTRVGWNLFGGQ